MSEGGYRPLIGKSCGLASALPLGLDGELSGVRRLVGVCLRDREGLGGCAETAGGVHRPGHGLNTQMASAGRERVIASALVGGWTVGGQCQVLGFLHGAQNLQLTSIPDMNCVSDIAKSMIIFARLACNSLAGLRERPTRLARRGGRYIACHGRAGQLGLGSM